MWTTQASRRVVETSRSGEVTQVSLVFSIARSDRAACWNSSSCLTRRPRRKPACSQEARRPRGENPSIAWLLDRSAAAVLSVDGKVSRLRHGQIDEHGLIGPGDGGVAGRIANG